MKTLNHPNLVKMLGVCIEKSPFYLVQVNGKWWFFWRWLCSRSCAVMVTFETTWSLLILSKLWLRWRNCECKNKAIMTKDYDFGDISGGEEQREVWKGAKVSKAGQLVYGHHQRWIVINHLFSTSWFQQLHLYILISTIESYWILLTNISGYYWSVVNSMYGFSMVLNKCLYNKDCHHRYSPHQRWTIHYQYDCTNLIFIFCHTYVAYRKKISSNI